MSILSLLLSAFVFGAAPTDSQLTLTCMTEFPTTTFLVGPVEHAVHGRVIHHNGTPYMPIHDGLVVPHDLNLLEGRGKALEGLGTDYTFKFPRENCEVHGEMVMRCTDWKTPVREINGHKVRFFSLSSSTSKEMSFVGLTEHVNMTLYLEVDGKDLFVPMRYMRQDCINRRPQSGTRF